MADSKKSFLMYCDWMELFEDLPDDIAGKLIKHIFRYTNDLNPETDDMVLKASFSLIKQALKRDLVKYEEKREQNRNNARKRWDAVASESKRSDAKHAVNDNDNVNVNDTVNVKENVKVKDIKQKPKFHFDDVVWPFTGNDFKNTWGLWEDYRKELGKKKYKPLGLQGALKDLSKLSDGNEEKAVLIIHQSINKGWAGFFELNNNGQTTKTRITADQLDTFLDEHS